MAGCGKIGSYFSRLLGGSRIWSRLFPDTGIYAGGKNGGILKEDALLSGGMLGSLYNKLSGVTAKARAFLATFAEDSRVLKRPAAFCRGILDTSVGSVGVFLFFIGLYSAAAFLIKLYADRSVDMLDPVYSAVIAFIGLVLMPVRRSLLGCIRSGPLTSYITEEMLAVSPFALDTEVPASKHIGWAVLLGTVGGIAGFFVSPLHIVLALLALIGIAVVLYSPEGGLYVSVFLLPFASPWISAAVALLASVSYICKSLIGKRNFYLTAADVFAFMFMISIAVAGIVTPFAYKETLHMVITLGALYLLCSNLMRSGQQLSRLMSAVNSGLLILSLCCIFSSLFGGELGGLGAYIGSKSAYSFMLPVLLPAALCTAFNKGFFSSGTVCCLTVYTAVALTFSEWMYLTAIGVTALFLLSCFRKRIGIIFGALLSAGAVMVLFATGIIKGDMYIPAFGSSGAADTMLKYGLYGIGFGREAFLFAFRSAGYGEAVKTDLFAALVIAGGWLAVVLFGIAVLLLLRRGLYAVSGKMHGVSRFSSSAALVLFCTLILSGAIGGMWQNPAIIMMFAVMCGALSGLPRIYEREVGQDNEEI